MLKWIRVSHACLYLWCLLFSTPPLSAPPRPRSFGQNQPAAAGGTTGGSGEGSEKREERSCGMRR